MREISRQCYMQPRPVETKMRNSFNATMKYQKKLWTRTLLERLINNNVGTNEVVNFALNLVNNSKSKNPSMFEKTVIENMKIKLDDATKAEKEAKYIMIEGHCERKHNSWTRIQKSCK